MAIAFRAPEISSSSVTHHHHHQGANQIQNHNPQPIYHGSAFVAVQGPLSPGGGGGIVILSPLSAVIQHQTAWWPTTVAPTMMRTQPSVAQQQMFSGFPPISQNNIVSGGFGAPAAAVVGVPLCHHPHAASHTPQPRHHHNHQRCVTSDGSCSACNDIRRVYLLLSLMLSNLVYSALKEL